MGNKKKPALKVPLTPLVRIADALHIVSATVNVTSSALAGSTDLAASHAASVLNEHVFFPLEKMTSAVAAHAMAGKPVHVEALVPKRRRKKRRPNGSRKGKKRQRNRWKQRQAALKHKAIINGTAKR